jgi:hypothetical protein
MKSRLLMWLALALSASGACLQAADAQSVTTLDPSGYVAGTDISNVFSGVTLQAMSLENLSNDPMTGNAVWTPSFAPVYAGEGGLFSPSSTGSPAFSWGPLLIPPTTSCLQQCTGLDPIFGTDLLVSFDTPVSMASVFQAGDFDNGVLMQAFNSSDQVVSYCLAAPGGPQPVGNYGCYSVSSSDGFENFSLTTSVSTGTTNISKILVGAYNSGGDAISLIHLGAPEIDPTSAASGFTLLLGCILVLRGRGRIKLHARSIGRFS